MLQKNLVIALMGVTVVLGGCVGQMTPDSTSQENPETMNQDVNTTNETSSEPMAQQDREVNAQACQAAIDTYLANAEDADIDDAQTVEPQNMITVHYIGVDEEGNVFDTSVEEVAQPCGQYNTRRNYQEGLSFTVQNEQMIPGFDDGVLGMNLNETKTIVIAPEDAYGEYDPDRQQEVPKDQINIDEADLQVGERIYDPTGMSYEILEVTDEMIILDVNHPLAGETLTFHVTVTNIQEAQAMQDAMDEASSTEITDSTDTE